MAKKSAKKKVAKKEVIVKKRAVKKNTSAKSSTNRPVKKSIKETGIHFIKVSGLTDDEKVNVELCKNQKTGKSLGYCYFCYKAVADFDTISKTHYECIGCGKKGKIKKLLDENPNAKKWESKRDYLNSTVFGVSSTYIPYVDTFSDDSEDNSVDSDD